jgi:hypothetical protein
MTRNKGLSLLVLLAAQQLDGHSQGCDRLNVRTAMMPGVLV